MKVSDKENTDCNMLNEVLLLVNRHTRLQELQNLSWLVKKRHYGGLCMPNGSITASQGKHLQLSACYRYAEASSAGEGDCEEASACRIFILVRDSPQKRMSSCDHRA